MATPAVIVVPVTEAAVTAAATTATAVATTKPKVDVKKRVMATVDRELSKMADLIEEAKAQRDAAEAKVKVLIRALEETVQFIDDASGWAQDFSRKDVLKGLSGVCRNLEGDVCDCTCAHGRTCICSNHTDGSSSSSDDDDDDSKSDDDCDAVGDKRKARDPKDPAAPADETQPSDAKKPRIERPP